MDCVKGNEYVTQENASPVTSVEEEVDECIDQNIQINSNKQMRIEYLYQWTLKFKDAHQESKYCQLREDMFRSNMLCVFIVWIFIVLCQSIIVPRCTILVVCLAISTILLTGGCILVMAEEFSGLPIFLQKSSATLVHHRDHRTIFICAVIVLMSAASSIGLFLCQMEQNGINSNATIILNPSLLPYNRSDDGEHLQLYDSPGMVHHRNLNKTTEFTPNINKQFTSSSSLNTIHATEMVNKSGGKSFRTGSNEAETKNGILITKDQLNNSMILIGDIGDIITTPAVIDDPFFNEPSIDSCSHPEYIVFTWVLCLIALATGLKLYYLVKTFMATIMVCCYAILITIVFQDVFAMASTESEDNSRYGMPLTARMNILLIVFLTMVTYHARLVEVTSRLDFIWKEQAEKELSNMKSNRILNDLLIKVSVNRRP